MAMNQVRSFAVVLEPEEGGGFTVRVPSLPEIVTYGKDEKEALAMAEDAIRLVLEDCTARPRRLPVTFRLTGPTRPGGSFARGDAGNGGSLMMPIRLVIAAICAGLAVMAAPLPSAAQTWPQRNVRFIVPLGPGSGVDIAARRRIGTNSAAAGRPQAADPAGGQGGFRLGPGGDIHYGKLATSCRC
jgi:predicted RNase H-like HicB family nuclease